MKNENEWTSNTRGCFSGCIGRKIIGVLFNIHRSLERTKTFVFDDGTGFTISDNGSFWREQADDIRDAIIPLQQRLKETSEEIKSVLQLAGQ
jgi:hypothetical protein